MTTASVTTLVVMSLIVGSVMGQALNSTCNPTSTSMYSMTGTLLSGEKMEFSTLSGKVTLVVNTANY